MPVSRRSMMSATAAAAAFVPWARSTAASAKDAAQDSQFRFCLNPSTIRKQTTDVTEQIRIAAEAGYDSFEPWMSDLARFQERGGQLSDLKSMLSDAGVSVESAIGFAKWIVNDDAERKSGLEIARRDMDTLAQIGGKRIAAPPIGAHRNSEKLNLFVIADRYRALLEVGDEIGVVPQLEVWGFSDNLSRLGEAVMVCVEASHPKACLLPDVYHIYRGGSDFTGLNLLHNDAIQVFHMNDYPDSPARSELNDADRVYPGDGVAPLKEILTSLGRKNRDVVLSLELFNPDYWKQDALLVAKTGLQKMKAAVASV